MQTFLFLLVFHLHQVTSYPGEIIYGCAKDAVKVKTNQKTKTPQNTPQTKVHFTYDDGPDLITTPQLLDKLKHHNISATFFLLTSNIEKDWDKMYPLVKRMIDEGHTIGSHTANHSNLIQCTEDEMKAEIDSATHTLEKILGDDFQPRLFRPPGGAIDEKTQSYLKEQGYTVESSLFCVV